MFYVKNLHSDHFLFTDGWHSNPVPIVDLSQLIKVLELARDCFPLVYITITTGYC